jgi:carbonic anhydrase
LIFDQGLGDLFIVRTAGHVLGHATLGSLEYAVSHLGVPLVLVLGHSDCGAVKAALSPGENETEHIQHLIEAIQPARSGVKKGTDDFVDQVARNHATLTAQKLQSMDPVFSQAVKAGRSQILAGFFSLETGGIEILE